jgi:hypothetical protein
MVGEYRRQLELMSWERGVCVIAAVHSRHELPNAAAGLRTIGYGYLVDLVCSCGGSRAAVWAARDAQYAPYQSDAMAVRTLQDLALTVTSGSPLIATQPGGAEAESSTLWRDLTDGVGVGCWFSEACRLGSGSKCGADGIVLTTPAQLRPVGMLVLMVCVASVLGLVVCAMLAVCVRLMLRAPQRSGSATLGPSKYLQDPKVTPYSAPTSFNQAALM